MLLCLACPWREKARETQEPYHTHTHTHASGTRGWSPLTPPHLHTHTHTPGGGGRARNSGSLATHASRPTVGWVDGRKVRTGGRSDNRTNARTMACFSRLAADRHALQLGAMTARDRETNITQIRQSSHRRRPCAGRKTQGLAAFSLRAPFRIAPATVSRP